MTSRERVLAAIDHKPVDRIPRVFKGTPEVEAQVTRELGLWSIDDVKDRFLVENLHWPWYWLTWSDPRSREFPDGSTVNCWGIRTKKADYGQGTYDEMVGSPLSDAELVSDIESYDWPVPDELDFSSVSEQLDSYADKAVCGPRAQIYEVANWMRGCERFLEDILLNPDLVWEMLARIEGYWTAYNEKLWELGKGRMQILISTDDFGTQRSMVMSRETWRKFFKPVYRRIYGWAKERGLRTQLHSCGAIRDIIPDLIEIGLDVLDPVQPTAAGMDPYQIKREFGKDLCLHGTIDVQGLLPFGKAAQVKDEVKRQIEVLGEGSGFILAPSHCIQPGAPIENIIAIYEAADEMC
ncbi:MAG: hypothetical protein HYX78_02855 [Armatimonadetes bacterium]|nr:hypothetical protein [Armatimonadota bacterium]